MSASFNKQKFIDSVRRVYESCVDGEILPFRSLSIDQFIEQLADSIDYQIEESNKGREFPSARMAFKINCLGKERAYEHGDPASLD